MKMQTVDQRIILNRNYRKLREKYLPLNDSWHELTIHRGLQTFGHKVHMSKIVPDLMDDLEVVGAYLLFVDYSIADCALCRVTGYLLLYLGVNAYASHSVCFHYLMVSFYYLHRERKKKIENKIKREYF